MRAPITNNPQRLAQLSLFKGVPCEPIQEYLDRCGEWTVHEGEVLLAPHRPNTHVFLVISGRLGVHLNSPQDVPIAVLAQGECAGEMSIIDRGRPSAFVTGLEDSRVLAIERETLWDLVHYSNGIARNLLLILSRRIRHGNGLIMETLQQQRRYERLATVDALTGLHNRLWLNHMFARELDRCRTDGTPLCLVMIDVDHFKRFNDRYGHLAGDELLRKVADVLREQVRPHDMIARFGGEEFALLLPDIAAAESRQVTERIRQQVERTPVEVGGDRRIELVTVSAGLAAARRDDTLVTLLSRADRALYRAKAGGRNCIVG